MTRKEFVKYMAERNEMTQKDADAALDLVISSIEEVVSKGESIKIFGFGSFDIVERAARNGVNPATGEPMAIPASKALKFKPAKKLKDLVKAQ